MAIEKKLEKKKRNKLVLVGTNKMEKENGSEVSAEIIKGDTAIKEKLVKKRNKLVGTKKRRKENGSEVSAQNVEHLFSEDKSEKVEKKKKKNHLSSKEGSKLTEKNSKIVTDEVYHISSGDRDCSKGMKKWVTEYHQSRPGLEVLQQRIDDFITAHEEREEQARQDRDARAADGGWTVVVHHKGRKKTTDSESGTTVGSVAQAAVEDKMAKKKCKEVGDFYRFQRREAQMNELMSLQSKFEQDKKRIHQLRAARKFKPY